MSYSLQKLEEDLTNSYKRISYLEDELESLEDDVEVTKKSLTQVYENVFDLEQTISKLKGETK